VSHRWFDAHNTEENLIRIGFIGAGDLAQAIGGQLASAGHDVTLSNSRGPASLAATAAALGVSAGTVAAAAANPVVFLAVNWTKNSAALSAAGDLTGRILVDTTNPIEAPHFVRYDLAGRTSSEIVADLAPGAHVVKAFNHMTPASFRDGPRVDGAPKVLFHSSDYADAHQVAAALIEGIGYVPINLGPLISGGLLHEHPGGPLPARTFVEVRPRESSASE
jgi:predicted dinucleotide-binding enzyme